MLAILPWELYESIVETVDTLGEEALMGAPRQRVQEIQEGRGVGGCKASIGLVTYRIVIAPLALRMRRENADRRVRESIRDRIDGLTGDPEKTRKVFDRGSCRVPRFRISLRFIQAAWLIEIWPHPYETRSKIGPDGRG